MKTVRTAMWILAIFVILGGGITFAVVNYSWLFAKSVEGEIVEVERITEPSALIGGHLTGSQIHSYAVLIQGKDGVMYTSSADDRQWEVAKKGYCVMATLYRYPPWNLEKGGTYYNARLKQIHRCPEKPDPATESQPVTPLSDPAAEPETGT